MDMDMEITMARKKAQTYRKCKPNCVNSKS